MLYANICTKKLLLLISLALGQWMLGQEEEQVQPSSSLAWSFVVLVCPMQTTLDISIKWTVVKYYIYTSSSSISFWCFLSTSNTTYRDAVQLCYSETARRWEHCLFLPGTFSAWPFPPPVKKSVFLLRKLKNVSNSCRKNFCLSSCSYII